jgi:TldD protein
MSGELTRRKFIKWAGAGAAVVSLPALAGCRSRATLLGSGSGSVGAHQTYFDRFGVGSELIQRVLQKGLSQGGDFAEIFFQHRIEHWTGMQDNQIDRAYSTIDLGAGIRVLKGDATGFAYCEDLSEKALLGAASTAAAVADGPPHVRPQPLAAVTVDSRYEVEVPWTEVGVERKLPVIDRSNDIARAQDSRIIKVTVFLGDQTTHNLVVNSDGLLIEDEQPFGQIYVACVAEQDGQVESSNWGASTRDGLRFFTNATIDRIAKTAADNTTLLLTAVPSPVGEMMTVLAPGNSAVMLHEAIGHGMEADFNRKGISIYADRIGKRVAPDFVSIADDGTNGRLGGSLNIDDEGHPCERTLLVENGILRSYLHDRISAKHYHTAQTGSGRRQSFRYPVVPRMRNTYMLAGPHDPQEIIASVKKGIYADNVWNGEVAIGAGDFAFYLKNGRMIENGKLTHVIKDANLIGNGPKVLEQVDMVGSDLTHFSGAGMCGKDGQYLPVGFGLPTVRAGVITVGGRNA